MHDKYLSLEANQARDQYANIMDEIKRRTRAITEMLAGTVPPQPQIIASEYCYLQLRLICELIVLGCAVAHGDMDSLKGKKIQKEWRAGELADKLEQLHPQFYPVPGVQIIAPNGKAERVHPVHDGFLALSDLKNLYGECGDRLHIGNIKVLLNNKRPAVDLERIRMWQNKIIRLLNHHQIQLFDPDYQLWTIMQAKEDGKVHVYLFAKVDKGTTPVGEQ